jgi:hypothetical protein
MRIRTLRVNEGQPFTFTERVQHQDKTDILQVEIDSISLRIFDDSVGDGHTAVHYDDSIDILLSVFDTLQVDGLWDRDSSGYNFKHVFDETDSLDVFLSGGKSYRLEYRFELQAGGFLLVPGMIHVDGMRRAVNL